MEHDAFKYTYVENKVLEDAIDVIADFLIQHSLLISTGEERLAERAIEGLQLSLQLGNKQRSDIKRAYDEMNNRTSSYRANKMFLKKELEEANIEV